MYLNDLDLKLIYNETIKDPDNSIIKKICKTYHIDKFFNWMIDNKLEVPDIIYHYIYDYTYLYDKFAMLLVKNNREVPDIVLQDLSIMTRPSFNFAEFLVENDKEVPDIILKRIADSGTLCVDFAKILIKNNKEIPDIILKSISKIANYSNEIATFLIQNNKEAPDILLKSLSPYIDYAYNFANLLIKKNKPVPDIIKKATPKINYNSELKENYFYKLYGNLLTENILFKVYNKLVGGDKVNMIKGGALGSTGVNYTNSEGVEVTLKDEDIEIAEFNGKEYLGDIEINYIGISNIKNRGKGLASKELDRILSVADSMDLSVSISIDPEEATKGGGVVGMFYNQLKSWYEKKGFIFDGRLGYRPKKSENREEIKPKKIYVSNDKIKQIEDQINSEIGRSFSDPDSLFEITLFQRKDLIGYLEGGNDRVYFYDGKNRPVIVANVKSKFDYKSNKFVISLIDNYMESYKD